MVKSMKNSIIVLISVITVVLFISCSNKSDINISGKNIDKYLDEILKNQIKIENIYRGSGLPTKEAQFIADGNGQCFIEVIDEDINTLDKLKSETERVFTKSYAEENFYQFAFNEAYARYKEIDGKLYEDIGIGGGLDRQWSPESLQVVSEDDKSITITVEYMNYNTLSQAKIIFIKDNGKVLIDKLLEKQ